MNTATMTGPLFDGGPTMMDLEDEGSLWHVPIELREVYLEQLGSLERRRVRELEGSVKAGLGGNKTITSSWLLGLRSEARNAAGLDPIPLDRIGDYRVTQGWPEELSGFEALVGWAVHQTVVEAAMNVADTRRMQEALRVSVGSATCPACSVPVVGPSSELCSNCATVLEVVRFDRARELGRERVEGRTTRSELVERWLAGQ